MNSTYQIGNCTYFNPLQPKFNAIKCPERNCFSIWKVDQIGKFDLLNKGCWKEEDCESNLVRNVLFCCCKGEFCNRHTDPDVCFDQVREQLNLSRIFKIFKKSVFSILPIIKSNYLNILTLFICLVLMLVLILYLRPIFKRTNFAILKRLIYLQFKRTNIYDEKKLMKMDSDLIEKDSIKLENGSHADIYKGRLINKDKKFFDVAIKIFRSENEFYFKNEFQIYNLPNFKHNNILEFIKAKKVNTDEFWLITKYQDQSSLLNFLKKSTLNLNQLIQICLDISNGLNYLHGHNKDKRTIAHLDIKPANVLLNKNLNACLADFELSKAFHNFKPLFYTSTNLKDQENSTQLNSYECSSTIQQIGTIRYSSPEILSGIVNAQKIPRTFIHQHIDLLLKSDIYSCSLVCWEMLNCLELNLNQVKNGQLNRCVKYRTVFENCKNDEELIECVVDQGERPVIDERLRTNCPLNLFCQTIEDCWSHDPRARLTSSRLYERLKSIHNLIL